MSGLHERFLEWLAVDGSGELPRDLALHASLCPDCGRFIVAHDALAAVDVGLADPPPSRLTDSDYVITLARVGRLAAGITGVALLGAVTAFGTSGLPAATIASPAPTVAEAVLGGMASRAETPSASTGASGEPTATPRPTISAASTEGARFTSTAAPVIAGESDSPTPGPVPQPPPPVPTASPTPQPPNPTQTATPSPIVSLPSVTPTSTPTLELPPPLP